MSVRILHGDCREILPTLDSDSVDCIVTSPPYYGLRSYLPDGHEHKPLEIGLEPTMSGYLETMVGVCRELRRLLKPSGCFFLNIGDSYFGGGRGGNPPNSPHQKQKTNRGSVSMPAGARRAIACDTPDKEPIDYQGDDCFCQSLCDACLAAYRIGKSHSGRPHASKPSSSMLASSRDRKVSQFVRPPMSGYQDLSARSLDATQDCLPDEARAASPLPAALESTSQQSYPRLPDACSRCGICGIALSESMKCLPDESQKTPCTCDNGAIVHPLFHGSQDRLFSASACENYTENGLKNKDLMMIPNRLAILLQEDGWYVRSEIIWHKPSPMPESVRDRPTSSHEKVWLLTKSPTYFYDADAIRETPSGRTGTIRSFGHGPDRQDIGNSYDIDGLKGANCRNVWTIATRPFTGSHFATMPPDLAERCIKAGSSERGCCPTCGAPWQRVIERESLSYRPNNGSNPQRGAVGVSVKHIGWEPTCKCLEFVCPNECTVIDSPHENWEAITKAPVPDMRVELSPVAQREQFLFEGMLPENDRPQPEDKVRAMRQANSDEVNAPEVLRQVLLCEMDGSPAAGVQERQNNDQSRICGDIGSGSSFGADVGVCDGASLGDGKGIRAPTSIDGNRSSPKRNQNRQQPGQPGDHEQPETRRAEEAGLYRDVPALPKSVLNERTCSCCGSRLVSRPQKPVPATILDCFSGAGTTAMVADRLGRHAIGIELNPAYAEMGRERVVADAGMFAEVSA